MVIFKYLIKLRSLLIKMSLKMKYYTVPANPLNKVMRFMVGNLFSEASGILRLDCSKRNYPYGLIGYYSFK